jgi:hypothetical protein
MVKADDGGGGLSSIGSLTSADGTSINWGNVLAVVAGAISVEYFSSVAETISALLTTWFVDPLSAVGYWLGNVVGQTVGAPARVAGSAWSSAAAFVTTGGVAGLVFGLAIVGATLLAIYVTAEVVR